MRTTFLAAPLLLLAGCASVEKMGDDFQWLFADTYQVQVSGTEKFDKQGVFLQFNRGEFSEGAGKRVDREGVQSILESDGFGFVAKEADAKSIMDVHWTVTGPEFESKTETVYRSSNCLPGSQSCKPEAVQVSQQYSICTYSLAMTVFSQNNGMTLNTQWKSVQKEGVPFDGSGRSVAVSLGVLLLTPVRRCSDSEMGFDKHLLALTYLLHQLPDAPQGNIELQEKKGRYRIKPPTKQEEAQH